jgi:hypothetical protein
MTASTQVQKRHRAASFPPARGADPTCGLLSVRWDSPFDRLCFMISSPELATKNSRRYATLLEELTTGSGCTEEEVLAHGNKVRAVLFFAHERLRKDGSFGSLAAKEKYLYQLPLVSPAF